MEIGVVGCFQDNGAVDKKNEDVIEQGQPTTVANGSSAVNVLTITTSQSIDGRISKLIDVKVIFSRGTTGLDQHIQYHRQAT